MRIVPGGFSVDEMYQYFLTMCIILTVDGSSMEIPSRSKQIPNALSGWWQKKYFPQPHPHNVDNLQGVLRITAHNALNLPEGEKDACVAEMHRCFILFKQH